jgi:hypothetical protein
MYGIRKLIASVGVAALAITALGAPATAADTAGTLAIVNGHPGQRVDICIGKKEQRSGAPYGSYYRKDVIGTGKRVVSFYKRNDRRTCGGTKLGAKVLDIQPGDDLTIVLTKGSPKVVVFDNTSPSYLGEIPPRGTPYPGIAILSWASAANFDANLLYTYWSPNAEFPAGPAANPVWSKGQRYLASFTPDYYLRLRATLPEAAETVAQRTVYLKASRRYEWVLVGTTPANARFVLINRGVSGPSA